MSIKLSSPLPPDTSIRGRKDFDSPERNAEAFSPARVQASVEEEKTPKRSVEAIKSGIRNLSVAVRNSNDGIAMLQVAEDAYAQVSSLLLQLRQLIVQGLESTTTTDEQLLLQEELEKLKAEIVAITEETEFNGRHLLNGSTAGSQSVVLQIGLRHSSQDLLTIQFKPIGIAANPVSLHSEDQARSSLTLLQEAFDAVTRERSRIEMLREHLGENVEQLLDGHNALETPHQRLKDATLAAETSAQTREQIVTKRGHAMMGQTHSLSPLAAALMF